MSRADFDDVMVIGSLRKALNDVSDKLGIDLTVQIPHDKTKLFQELQKKYDDFYEMSVEQRLVYSEMASSRKESNE